MMNPERIETARVWADRVINDETADVMAELDAICTYEEKNDVLNCINARDFEDLYNPVLKAVAAENVLDFLDDAELLYFYRVACVLMMISKSEIKERRAQKRKSGQETQREETQREDKHTAEDGDCKIRLL